jgi:hypothetical protein
MDQVEVASSHLTLLNAALGWPHAHYRVRSGPDGADQALLDVLQHENVASRFTHVAIGSGDHLFAEEAAHLAAQGVWVTVVSRRHSLSRRLALAARQVIFLDTLAEAALCARRSGRQWPSCCALTQSLRLPPLTMPRTENPDDDLSPVG